MAPKAATSKTPQNIVSEKSAGKRKASAVEKATASPGTKKQKDNAGTASPKSILKKTNLTSQPKDSKPTFSSAAKTQKGKGKAAPPSKSPLTSRKPVQEENSEVEDGEESLDSEEEAEMLKGLSSDDGDDNSEDDDDDANSSDEDEDDDDDDDSSALKRHSSILTSSLPSSKDDTAVKQRLDRLAKQRQSLPSSQVHTAVLYIGHLPKHFTEQPLRQYFSQFGSIHRLRLSRNKKTGASKHYAFIEFADEEVGKIVQETMDNYLILGQLLKVKMIDKADVHPKLWIGANRTFRKVPGDRIARVQHDGAKTPEQKAKVESRLLSRQEKKRKALKEAGIDYDFEGYKRGVVA